MNRRCGLGQHRFECIAGGAIGYGEGGDGCGLDEVGEVGVDTGVDMGGHLYGCRRV